MNLAWLVPAAFAPGAAMTARTLWRQRRHLPAAPDNQPPADTDALIVCRRIARLPLADPEMARQADQYLRDKQRKEKP